MISTTQENSPCLSPDSHHQPSSSLRKCSVLTEISLSLTDISLSLSHRSLSPESHAPSNLLSLSPKSAVAAIKAGMRPSGSAVAVCRDWSFRSPPHVPSSHLKPSLLFAAIPSPYPKPPPSSLSGP
ncbi:hypothetical protein Syun_003615 [Stephania yunnanensis]|uniref:Uncharacterized protein n=1 Tax=Stephania yunnanensis TaxID=152371 RepID=A0AAP0Q0D6_9MAGN